MENIVFVPVSDELLFDHPERIRGPLIPYAPGMRITGDTPAAKTADNPKQLTTRRQPASPIGSSRD